MCGSIFAVIDNANLYTFHMTAAKIEQADLGTTYFTGIVAGSKLYPAQFALTYIGNTRYLQCILCFNSNIHGSAELQSFYFCSGNITDGRKLHTIDIDTHIAYCCYLCSSCCSSADIQYTRNLCSVRFLGRYVHQTANGYTALRLSGNVGKSGYL